MTHLKFYQQDGITLPGPQPKTFNEARAIYNSVPVHARPIAQNVVSNTLLKHLENKTDSTKSITITNHPLPDSNPVFVFIFRGMLRAG